MPELDPLTMIQALGQATQQPNLPPVDSTTQTKPTLAKQGMNRPASVVDLIRPPKTMQADKPGDIATARPASRLDVFENFLSNFVGALGQGLANTGHGPGSFGRGFGAAVNYPIQRQAQVNELAQQQAQTQREQAQANLAQRQAEMGTVYLPGIGQVTAPMGQLGNILRGAGAAGVSAGAKVETQKLYNQNKLDAIRLQTEILKSKGGKFIPDTDPQTGRMFYHVMNPFGQEIGQTDVNAISSLMQRSSGTQEFKQLDDGSVVALPKTTVSGPVIPNKNAPMGRGRLPVPSGGTPNRIPQPQAPSGGGGGGIRVQNGVVTLNGQPILGKGAITGTTRTMVETSPKVIDLANRMVSQIDQLEKSGDVGPGMSRWNDFWSGKVGTDNQLFHAMMTNAGLLSTLLMRMHVGAKGGERIMEHFDQMIGAGHQSATNMRAALGEILTYANDVKGAAPLPKNFGNFNQGPDKVKSLVDKYTH